VHGTVDVMEQTLPVSAPAATSDRGAASVGAPAVLLRDVHKSFGAVHAVRGIDLRIEPGEVVAFLGPNGAGKTTTIDLLLGLSRPTQGSIEVLGLDPHMAVRRGEVAAVMQSGGLLKDLTVAETVQLTAALFSYPRPVDEVLHRAGIADIAGRRVAKCSGGQQQRLRFALSLLPDPLLLILDEPTTGMDVEGRRDFWSAIRADAERGRTVLFATHYLDEADAYADRVVVISHGRVVADGSAAEVRGLVSGRVVSAALAPAHDRALADLPGVDGVERRGERVLIRSTDSDAVARYLLQATPARDIEVTSTGLEDAFLALTGDSAQPLGRTA
jgi:ABC-2 type transport system ATP-binding protein